MTAPQFAYSNLTLDELRSLAASPQVGTLHAMPQSFRALADRVGEVADLLTHTQVNLHTWWKGPAAEQAAEALAKAAAEAREFHGSALAAASAVSRCAQVVEAQQHQMMNIPEVAEPGATDVVHRPTTPLEALEAARQDNTYQAARQQAVQVVNGIAAQYVETRDELGLLTTTRGENFIVSTRAIDTPVPYTEKQAGTYFSYAGPTTSEPHHPPTRGHYNRPAGVRAAKDSYSASRNKIRPADPKEFSLQPHTAKHVDASENNGRGPTLTDPLRRPIRSTETTVTQNDEPKIGDFLASNEPASSAEPQPHWESQHQTTVEYANHKARQDNNSPKPKGRDEGSVNRAAFNGYRSSGDLETGRPTPADRAPQFIAPQPVEHFPLDPDAASSQIIPPYSGIGHITRARESHSKCPDYLKERRSVWLPNTIAAPPDGVLSPEWFQQH